MPERPEGLAAQILGITRTPETHVQDHDRFTYFFKLSALEGIRILDLSCFYAEPYCSTLFADKGEEVSKIEALGGEATRDKPPEVEKGIGGRYTTKP
jgi:hypothetical protein